MLTAPPYWAVKPCWGWQDGWQGGQAMRRELWNHAYFSISNKDVDMVKIPRPLVDRFIDSLCYAA
jgi:hypothetical protein